MNLGKNVKITSALAYAEANSDRNGAVLDMQGYDGVLAIVTMAAIAGGAVTTVKMQQDTAVGFAADPQDLLGTGISIADDDDDQIFVIDLYRPLERFVRVVMDKDAANNTAESAIYVQYCGSKAPIENNVTDLVTYELHTSPAEGTA